MLAHPWLTKGAQKEGGGFGLRERARGSRVTKVQEVQEEVEWFGFGFGPELCWLLSMPIIAALMPTRSGAVRSWNRSRRPVFNHRRSETRFARVIACLCACALNPAGNRCTLSPATDKGMPCFLPCHRVSPTKGREAACRSRAGGGALLWRQHLHDGAVDQAGAWPLHCVCFFFFSTRQQSTQELRPACEDALLLFCVHLLIACVCVCVCVCASLCLSLSLSVSVCLANCISGCRRNMA